MPKEFVRVCLFNYRDVYVLYADKGFGVLSYAFELEEFE